MVIPAASAQSGELVCLCVLMCALFVMSPALQVPVRAYLGSGGVMSLFTFACAPATVFYAQAYVSSVLARYKKKTQLGFKNAGSRFYVLSQCLFEHRVSYFQFRLFMSSRVSIFVFNRFTSHRDR